MVKMSPPLSLQYDYILVIIIKEQDLGAILASSVNKPHQRLLVVKQADNGEEEEEERNSKQTRKYCHDI